MRPMTWGEVFHCLTTLKEQGPSRNGSGICYNFECCATDAHGFDTVNYWGVMSVMFRLMGVDKFYPVQHPTMPAEDAYNKFLDLWDVTTEYGCSRWAFLDRLIYFAEAQPQDSLLPDYN